METKKTSLERVLTTLGYQEPDRVPIFLLLTLHGAKELGVSVKTYFSNPENVFEGQMKMVSKYSNDCLYAFYYASIETEAFGGNTIFIEEGPPNAGAPVIKTPGDIRNLKPPVVDESKPLQNVLQTIRMLKKEVEDKVPIIGVVMSPFSLLVMQMGFDKYLDLIYSDKGLFDLLMKVNQEFCINWANAQLNAGATAICYFDPVSSPSMIPPAFYRNNVLNISKDTLSKINGPTATHFASGRTIPIIDDVAQTGTNIICSSSLEDIGEVKNIVNKRMAVLGNLDGIQMCRWTEAETEQMVKNIIDKAGKGGGLILADNHGEIPYQVPEKNLRAISAAVEKYGIYPLQ